MVKIYYFFVFLRYLLQICTVSTKRIYSHNNTFWSGTWLPAADTWPWRPQIHKLLWLGVRGVKPPAVWGLDSSSRARHCLLCCWSSSKTHRTHCSPVSKFSPKTALLSSTQICKKSGSCFACGDIMLNHATEVLKILGGVGLFFSFTEVGANIYDKLDSRTSK